MRTGLCPSSPGERRLKGSLSLRWLSFGFCCPRKPTNSGARTRLLISLSQRGAVPFFGCSPDANDRRHRRRTKDCLSCRAGGRSQLVKDGSPEGSENDADGPYVWVKKDTRCVNDVNRCKKAFLASCRRGGTCDSSACDIAVMFWAFLVPPFANVDHNVQTKFGQPIRTKRVVADFLRVDNNRGSLEIHLLSLSNVWIRSNR